MLVKSGAIISVCRRASKNIIYLIELNGRIIFRDIQIRRRLTERSVFISDIIVILLDNSMPSLKSCSGVAFRLVSKNSVRSSISVVSLNFVILLNFQWSGDWEHLRGEIGWNIPIDQVVTQNLPKIRTSIAASDRPKKGAYI